MSRAALTTLIVAAASAALACRYQPTPVQLQGSSGDIAALAGKWDGAYDGTESGRTGSISFEVRAEKDSAYGDVLMEPRTGGALVPADRDGGVHAMHVSNPSLLRVTFVRVSGGMVEGAMEKYIAPDCQCAVSTVFRGTLSGTTISGEFVTTGPMGLRQTGKWSVTRRDSR